MAKTLMISNTVYGELKKLKGKEDKSFSEVITELIINRRQKTGYDLKKHFGVLKNDKEFGKIQKELKVGWRRWQKRYA